MPFLRKRLGVGSGNFGDALRELRELRGLHREELGRLLGIHPAILETLEEERLEDLADPVYAERHVRALSAFLEGRSRYLVETYRELLDRRGAIRSHAVFPRPRIRARDLLVSSRVLSFFVCVGVVGLLAGYLGWQARILAVPPQLEILSPQEGARFEKPLTMVIGVTDSGVIVFVNGRRVVVDGQGRFTAAVDLPRGLSAIRIEARRRYGSSAAVIERHLTYTPPS